jgi:TFIIF-interacting CTD phosphatase-like protein
MGKNKKSGKNNTDRNMYIEMENLDKDGKAKPTRLVILDIEGTLIDGTCINKGTLDREVEKEDFDFKFTDKEGDQYFIKKRPGLDSFLEWIFGNSSYTVAFWSTASRDFVNNVLSFLLKKETMHPLFIWTRDECEICYELTSNYGEYDIVFHKELSNVWNHPSFHFSKENILVVDDTPASYSSNYNNAIPIEQFFLEQNYDTELERIQQIIQVLDSHKNVLNVEKRLGHPFYLEME